MFIEILIALCLQYTNWECDELTMRASHLEFWVVKPTLKKLAAYDERMNTETAIKLLMGTAAQESDLWFNLSQLGGGPGLGGNSIEPETHADVLRYLNRKDKWELREIVLGFVPEEAVSMDENGNYTVDDAQLVSNMLYSTAIARIRYWYVSEPLPPPDDIEAIASYYKRFFNTKHGAATESEFVGKYRRLVADK